MITRRRDIGTDLHWQIIELHKGGHSHQAISKTLGVHPQTVLRTIADGIPQQDGKPELVQHEAILKGVVGHGKRKLWRCKECGAKLYTHECVKCNVEKYSRMSRLMDSVK